MQYQGGPGRYGIIEVAEHGGVPIEKVDSVDFYFVLFKDKMYKMLFVLGCDVDLSPLG